VTSRVVLLCALLVAGCSGRQSALDAAGDHARRIVTLWDLMLWVCGIMYVLVLGFLAAAIWKRRRTLIDGQGSSQAGTHERGLRRALGGWTALIVAGLLVLITGSFLIDRQLAQARAMNTLRIKITAAQWWWKVEYEDPIPSQRIVTANELYLPIDRAVEIQLQADDVIHSFWVPNLAGKQDLIPGRTNTLSFTPRRTGIFRGQCAEFCGLQHANMAFDAIVLEPAQFDAWRARQRQPAPAPQSEAQIRGLEVFTTGACASCHQIVGTPAAGQTGPNLTHLASRKSLAAGAAPYSSDTLRDWLRDPHSLKPGNHMPQVTLAPPDIDALVAYLDSLK
jgi:cytochrome c oxidase subunit II